MIKKVDFDEIIKQNVIEVSGCDVLGYKLLETRSEPYGSYYSNDEFEHFLEEMNSPPYIEIFRAYKEGKGGELYEKNGRYGKMPPKMASVASSSRFCYLALRDGAQALGCSGRVLFEQECEMDNIKGNAPQLDAYIPNENIYVEAKCHEIFDSHRVKMKGQYWKLIYGEGNSFGFEVREKTSERQFEIPLSVFGIEGNSSMFDIKQFLCHLLGIKTQNKAKESATLVYLFFKPKVKSDKRRKEIDEVFERLQDEVIKIFNSAPIQQFVTSAKIHLRAVAEYSEVMEALSDNNVITLTETFCKDIKK